MVAAGIIALMSIAFACGSWSRAGLYCNHQDLSPRFAGEHSMAAQGICLKERFSPHPAVARAPTFGDVGSYIFV